MCRVFGVSRGSYYAWRQRQLEPSRRQQRRTQLDQRVRRAHEARRGRSGSPGLTRDLGEQGHGSNVLIEESEQDRSLTDIDWPEYRLVDIPWEGITWQEDHYVAIVLCNNEFGLVFVIPDGLVSGELEVCILDHLEPPRECEIQSILFETRGETHADHQEGQAPIPVQQIHPDLRDRSE